MKRLIILLLLALIPSFVYADTFVNGVSCTMGSDPLLNADGAGATFTCNKIVNSITLTGCGDSDAAQCRLSLRPSSCANYNTCSKIERLTVKAVSLAGTPPNEVYTFTVRARDLEDSHRSSGDWSTGDSVDMVLTSAQINAKGDITATISDSDTTHCPDGNSVFDALAGKQTADQDLTDIAALSCAANTVLGKNGGNAWACLSSLNLYFTDPLLMHQNITPANPSSGDNKLYFKSDNKLYKLTSAGVESEVGTGGYTNLTSFVDQTNWRIFYSNGSGDVTELALGADGTYLRSNGASSAPTFDTPTGSGTVNSGVQYHLTYYPSNGTTVDDSPIVIDANGYAITTAYQTSTADRILLRNDYEEAYGAGWMGPHATSSMGASYYLQLPATAPSGTQVIACGTPTATVSTCTFGSIGVATGTSLAVTGALDGRVTLVSGTTIPASGPLTTSSTYVVCTGNCTITPMAPAAGVQVCARTDNNTSATITFAALGATKYYEKPDHTGYGTATTGTLSATATTTNSICLIGLDASHYLVWGTPIGTWTAN